MSKLVRPQIILLLLFCLTGCQQQAEKIEIPVAQMIQGRTMGTSYVVKYMQRDGGPSKLAVEQQVKSVLEAVNAQMSTYIASSELSRFNVSVSTEWFEVSADTAQVAALAKQISEKTSGGFDITVGPLVDLWGFGPSRQRDSWPTDDEIAATLQKCGEANLEVRLRPPALKKNLPGLRVDMSAIAKGHGVDRVAEQLEALGVHSYFVEIGGEIRAAGFKGPKARWRAGIEKPIETGREILTAVELDGVALATSGNYRNFYELDGKKYWHTIDPRTGLPAEAVVLQASVIAATCAEADAIATSLMVLGKDALATAEQHGWDVMLVSRRAEGLQVDSTKGFSKLLPSDLQGRIVLDEQVASEAVINPDASSGAADDSIEATGG